jgi:protein-disulfide isomerase
MTVLIARRTLMSAAGAALLVGCGGGAGAAGEDASDMALGDPAAPIKLIEYASVTCPHCAQFHAQIWPQLKANYVDTGKVRFIFREFPTDPVELAVAGFQTARCGNASPEQYFTRLGALFEQQQQMFEAYTQGKGRDHMLAFAQASGISESQFAQCVSDTEGMKRIEATAQKGSKEFKISGTPTLVLNGEPLSQQYLSYEALSKLIDSKLAGK